jgi:hypothetical protein
MCISFDCLVRDVSSVVASVVSFPRSEIIRAGTEARALLRLCLVKSNRNLDSYL